MKRLIFWPTASDSIAILFFTSRRTKSSDTGEYPDLRSVKNDRILNPIDFTSTDYEQLMGPVAAGGLGISGDKYGLLANYIESISCSSTKDSRTARGLITVGLRLEYADQEYVTTLNLEGRNF